MIYNDSKCKGDWDFVPIMEPQRGPCRLQKNPSRRHGPARASSHQQNSSISERKAAVGPPARSRGQSVVERVAFVATMALIVCSDRPSRFCAQMKLRVQHTPVGV